MEKNTVHLVLFSPCGGTAKAAKALARDFTIQPLEHDITLPSKRTGELSFSQKDFVIFGFPVYGGRMPQNIAQIFASLQGQDTPCALVAVYGNRAFEGALLDLHTSAVSRGFKPVGAVAAIAEHSISPHIATNRPDAADLDQLAEFGLRILEHMKNGNTLEKAPGAYPDWQIPAGIHFFPVTDMEICVQCGECARVCSNAAIPQDDPGRTETEKCIVCAACLKYCPQKARTLGKPGARETLKSHLLDAVARKEAELFL